MELTNEFEVPVSLEEAWKTLTDLEVVAPCLPGAELKEVEGEEYRGLVRVKVGPITASYKGAASFTELDTLAHRAVLRAEGRETRGQGNASATVTATLSESGGERTKVSVVTELNITGKVAQFGRGVLADVSSKLLEQFAANLETTVLAPAGATGGEEPPPAQRRAPRSRKQAGESAGTGDGGTAPAPAADETEQLSPVAAPEEEDLAAQGGPAKTEGDEAAIRRIDGPASEPIDLVEAAGGSLAKRLLPYASIAGGLFLLRIVIYAFKRRKK